MSSILAATEAGQEGDGVNAGTVKSLLLKVALAALRGPVTDPVSGRSRGPMVQETPNRGAVLPLTRALRETASPFCDEVQLNPPEIVPGLAVNPIVGVMPGTSVSTTDRGPYSWPSVGESNVPVASHGGAPLTSVTIPQNLALTLATVAGPAVSDPLVAVPTSPSW
jgi:hypothetical protein